MLFDSPLSFDEALKSRKVKALLPTELSSGELAKIPAELRERAMFSARNSYAEVLQAIGDTVENLLNPQTIMRDGKPVTAGLDPATARLELKKLYGVIGYAPNEDERDSIKDFSSDARINLVLKTNTEMAQGYGAWQQGQDENVLDAFPAQELYRAEGRKEPRDWESRWTEAGGELTADGRMIALKNDDIWTEISEFDLPYPPFDYNSGMWVRDIARDEAMELGLIDRDTQIAPQDRGFNDDLEASPDIRSAALKSVLEELGYQFDKGVLTL